MLLTDLLDKKIINIFDGEFLGRLGDADLIISEKNGAIDTLVIQENHRRFMQKGMSERREQSIPWSAIKKIGSEIIVIDHESV